MTKEEVLCGVCERPKTTKEDTRRFLEDKVPKWACERCWGLMMPLQLHPGGIRNPLPNARRRAKEEDLRSRVGAPIRP